MSLTQTTPPGASDCSLPGASNHTGIMDEEFFSFDAFNDGFRDDLSLLFSAPLETPPTANKSPEGTSQYCSQHHMNAVLTSSPHPRSMLQSHSTLQPDMNDPVVLGLYTQLIIFQQDNSKKDLIFPNADDPTQDALHLLARRLSLEYERSLRPPQVRISKHLQASSFESPLTAPECPPYLFQSPPQRLDTPPDDVLFLENGYLNGLGLNVTNSFTTPTMDVEWEKFLAKLGNQSNVADSTVTVDHEYASEGLEAVREIDNSTPMRVLSTDCDFEMAVESPAQDIMADASSKGFTEQPVQESVQTPQEYIFISNQTAAQRKIPAPGRRRAMDEATRIASRAVKAVGACWKCKILRKKCNPGVTCDCCLKGDQDSTWKAIGCRRGPLECQLPHITFCPAIGADTNATSYIATSCNAPVGRMTPAFPNIRDELPDFYFLHEEFDSKDADSKVASLIRDISGTISSYSQRSTPEYFISVLESTGLLGLGFSKVFKSISRSYMLSTHDELITLSLECLHSCLKILISPATHDNTLTPHERCTPSRCTFQLAQGLEMYLQEYVNYLSREMFKKKNIRGDKSWWIPAFDSLCIQAYVGRILAMLSKDSGAISHSQIPMTEYLHLAVKIFEAISPGFDPFLGPDSTVPSPFTMDCETMAVARNREKYPPSSLHYLRSLFNMSGEVLRTRNQNEIANREPPITTTPTVTIRRPSILKNPLHIKKDTPETLLRMRRPKLADLSPSHALVLLDAAKHPEVAATELTNRLNSTDLVDLNELMTSFGAFESGMNMYPGLMFVHFFTAIDRCLFGGRLRNRVDWKWANESQWYFKHASTCRFLKLQQRDYEISINLSKPSYWMQLSELKGLLSIFVYYLIHSHLLLTCGHLVIMDGAYDTQFKIMACGIESWVEKWVPIDIRPNCLKGVKRDEHSKLFSDASSAKK